ncbi:hypothetical protein B0A55_10053 [Friedmanniomyces simplex]|uniref:F-box domain-containing protein n=1 Tax=Friedmanniomyces simplex TaxID=329884 RepID=A0A4U0WSE2_9PEZI|nr:hypothetical protein B0A55_10053 [Friedmanniomyces simplex]
MATTPPQRSFLSLPREIRDQIISYLLVKVEEPPTNPSRAGRRHSTRENVVSSTNHPAFRFTKLAHVSRQLRDEVADHGESMSKKGQAVAKLDIMFNGYLYHPTWTYVPALLQPGRPFELKIHTRLLTTESFRSSDRRPVTGIVNLFKILNAILRKGPIMNFP